MAGTGFNYIREIMQMNLPDESTPEPLKEYEREEKAKKFHYIGLTPYEPFDNNCTVRLMPAGMAGVIAVHKSELRPYNAEVNDVVQFCGRLLVFTEYRHWVQFVPGPCTNYDGPKPEKLALGWPKTNKEEKNMAISMRYLGKSTVAIRNGSTESRVKINGEIVQARPGDLAVYDFELYAFVDDDPMRCLPSWKKIGSIDFNGLVRYDKVKPNWLSINKVHFSGDKTIVMWADGTKTMVSCGDNESFDPEKGLVMAVAKKAFGNQGNYYNQIRKWLPEKDDTIEQITEPDPSQEYMDSARDLITDMALNGATKAELVRAIRFSKELIDGFKATPSEKPEFNPFKLEKDYGIAALREKYQKPKKTK